MATSLETLYEEKFQIIYFYLRKLGCPKEDAEDIVQTTFSKAIEDWIHLSVDQPTAWLFRVAVNHYYDMYRRRRRFPNLSASSTFFEEALGGEDDSVNRLLEKEASDELQAVLQTMTPSYAHLLLLKYEASFSYEEIGELLDMKPDNVRTTLYRARQQFQTKWREYDETRR